MPDETAQLGEYHQKKNKDAVCVGCWINDKTCNHEWPCSACADSDQDCFYVRCPENGCSAKVKCPAFHSSKRFKFDGHLVSGIHLIALIESKPKILDTYNLRYIQDRHNKEKTIEWCFNQIRDDIQEGGHAIIVVGIRNALIAKAVDSGYFLSSVNFKANQIFEMYSDRAKNKDLEQIWIKENALR